MARPKKNLADKMKEVKFYLRPDELEWLEAFGGGNRQAGFRKMLARFMDSENDDPVPDSEDEPKRIVLKEVVASAVTTHPFLASLHRVEKTQAQIDAAEALNKPLVYRFTCERCREHGNPGCNACRKANGIQEI